MSQLPPRLLGFHWTAIDFYSLRQNVRYNPLPFSLAQMRRVGRLMLLPERHAFFSFNLSNFTLSNCRTGGGLACCAAISNLACSSAHKMIPTQMIAVTFIVCNFWTCIIALLTELNICTQEHYLFHCHFHQKLVVNVDRPFHQLDFFETSRTRPKMPMNRIGKQEILFTSSHWSARFLLCWLCAPLCMAILLGYLRDSRLLCPWGLSLYTCALCIVQLLLECAEDFACNGNKSLCI